MCPLPCGARSPAFKVQGSAFDLGCSIFDVQQPFFACPRADSAYDSRRWCRASAVPSHAGNRRSTGPPTEAHEDMFTGPQHTLTLRGNLRFPYMNLKWIAQRLHMGSWTYVSNLLNEQPPTQPQAQEVLPLCQ